MSGGPNPHAPLAAQSFNIAIAGSTMTVTFGNGTVKQFDCETGKELNGDKKE
jgi:hypothetical protein